jgi:hypothetical protein
LLALQEGRGWEARTGSGPMPMRGDIAIVAATRRWIGRLLTRGLRTSLLLGILRKQHPRTTNGLLQKNNVAGNMMLQGKVVATRRENDMQTLAVPLLAYYLVSFLAAAMRRASRASSMSFF